MNGLTNGHVLLEDRCTTFATVAAEPIRDFGDAQDRLIMATDHVVNNQVYSLVGDNSQ